MLDLAPLPVEESCLDIVERFLQRGMATWGVEQIGTLDEWASEHFYLSGESSYVEQHWTPWPFQRAIMSCISNDDIVEVDLKKSARVGYSKILLAALGYFGHKRRNQCLWQPTDDDAIDFMKSEVETMLRDVPVMRTVFPSYLQRHKDNTLDQKRFIGSVLRVKGGKAAKNYRRISIDCAYLDEADAFDNDVEKEGDPCTLARKRIEGATFPKFVCGSTPKLKGFSLIDARFAKADERFTFQIACPHCAGLHAITWGGKDLPHGLKWLKDQPATVKHLCPHCGALTSQSEYLAAAESGVYVNDTGTIWLHADATFTTPDGTPVPTPRHVALHVWTAYSPVVAWSEIVAEFAFAHEKLIEGDDTKMKAFVNTTLGLTWEGEIEKLDADDIKRRAEPFPLRLIPRDCLLLLCSVDTQDNRLEAGVWGYGRGGEMWTIDHRVFFGNPELREVWDELESFLRDTLYPHARGVPQRIYATAVDSGGHHANAVYAFAHRCRTIRVHAIKGAASRERSIEMGSTKVSYTWNGRTEKHGPMLWHVGTNLAKDRFHARLDVAKPGPGYVHLSNELSDEWFKQLTGEVRATRRMKGGTETRWTQIRARIEVRDCLTYAVWLEERLDLWHPRKAKWWDQLEAAVQPDGDLFASAPLPLAEGETPKPAPQAKPDQAKPKTQPQTPAPNPFVKGDFKL